MVEPLFDPITPWVERHGDGSFFLDPFASGRMGHAETPRVKHEPAHCSNLAGRLAIDRITQKRVSEKTIVHSDLMSATGVQRTKDQGGAILCSVKDMKIGDGRFASTRITDFHALPMNRVPRDVIENSLMSFLGRRLSHGEVEFRG